MSILAKPSYCKLPDQQDAPLAKWAIHHLQRPVIHRVYQWDGVINDAGTPGSNHDAFIDTPILAVIQPYHAGSDRSSTGDSLHRKPNGFAWDNIDGGFVLHTETRVRGSENDSRISDVIIDDGELYEVESVMKLDKGAVFYRAMLTLKKSEDQDIINAGSGNVAVTLG